MDKLKSFFKKIEIFLVPSPVVGGLVIEDFALQYLELAGKEFLNKNALLRLPPGIVEQGRIKDRTNLIAALKELRKQIREDEEVVNVVLSLPSTIVYVQAFDVPAFAKGDLKETTDLNLRMISPIDFDQAYSGWQRIEDGINNDGRIKFLGAFLQKTIVDEFSDVLKQANFGIATVEFSSLSLIRCLRSSGILSLKDPQVVIHAVSGGINMILTESGSLYFNYFFPWSTADGALTVEGVLKEMDLGLQQMINFYAGRNAVSRVKSVIIVTEQLGDRMSEEINKNHPDLSVKLVPALKASVLLGAAKRGAIRKEDDAEIDLSGPSGFELFREHKILQFGITWKNILTAVFGFILFLFIASLLFVNRLSAMVVSNTFANPADVAAALASLQSQAADFNNLVAANEEARNTSQKYSNVLSGIGASADQLSINIQRVSFNGIGQAGVISGTASSQASALSFKDDLAALPELESLDLPFSSITTGLNGGVSFTINFVLKSLN